jgi:two-component system NtrC family response regulator
MPCHQSDRIRGKQGAARILVVDDDAGSRAVLAEVLSRRGYQVQEAPDGFWVSTALRAGAFSFDLVVLDWKMPGLDGLAVLRLLRSFASETLVILISIAPDEQLRLEAVSLGAIEVLRKPINFDALVSLLERALQRMGRE